MMSSSQPAILILGSGKYFKQILEMLSVIYPTVTIVQISYSGKRQEVPASRYCPIVLGSEIQKVDEFVKTGNYRVIAIYNRSDTYIQLHGQLVDHFHVPGPSEKSVNFFRQKNKMHQLMTDNDLGEFRPQTEIRHFSRISESFLQKLSYPVVVKPMIGAKSRGVFLLNRLEDFGNVKAALQKHFLNEQAVQLADTSDIVLFEEYVRGKQVTLTAYIDEKGKLHSISSVDVTTARDVGLPHMQLIYRTTPSKYPEYIRQKMEFVLQQLASASGLRSTFLHPDFIVSGNRVILIELNCRIGGFRYEMTKYAYHLDINKMAIQLAMGDDIDDQLVKVKSCTACEVWEEKSGQIQQFSIPKSKYIVDASQRLFPGDLYRQPPDGNVPLGRFFVVSENDDSLKLAKKLRKQVKVKIEDRGSRIKNEELRTNG